MRNEDIGPMIAKNKELAQNRIIEYNLTYSHD